MNHQFLFINDLAAYYKILVYKSFMLAIQLIIILLTVFSADPMFGEKYSSYAFRVISMSKYHTYNLHTLLHYIISLSILSLFYDILGTGTFNLWLKQNIEY